MILLLITTLVLMVAGSATLFLYRTALLNTEGHLHETANSQARLLETVARFNREHNGDYPGGADAATLSQIIETHRNYKAHEESGEFALGRMEAGKIVFYVSHRRFKLEKPDPLPLNSPLGEPMHRALQGQSGVMTGLDYRGVEVLAAYEPVPILNMGLVAKIDLAEIRAPFITTAPIILGLLVVAILAGLTGLLSLFRRFTASLEESEERYRRAVRGTNDGIWERNVRTGENHFSLRWHAMLGYQPGELKPVLETFIDLMHPDDADRINAAVQRHLEQREPYDMEMRLRKKDGKYLWVRSRGQAVWDASGKPLYMSGSISDISAEREAKSALLESERRLNLIFNSSKDSQVLIRVGEQGRYYFEMANQAYRAFQEATRPGIKLDMRGMERGDYLRTLGFPEDSIAVELPAYHRVVETGVRESYPIQVPWKEGETLFLEISIDPVLDDAGHCTHLLYTAHDITSQELVRRELEAEKLFNLGIFDNTPALVIVHDKFGRIVRINRAAAETVGYTQPELEGRNSWELLFPEGDDQKIQESFAQLQKMTVEEALEAFGTSVERPWRSKDGRVRKIHWNLSYLGDQDGMVAYHLASGLDVTERLTAEDALRKSELLLAEAQRLSQLGSWELDHRGNQLTWSDEIFRIFEIDPTHFGASYEAFLAAIHPEDRDLVNAAFTKSLESGEIYSINHRLLMPDGQLKYVQEIGETTYAETGAAMVTRGTVQDITKNHQLERELEQQRDFAANLVATTPMIVLLLDLAGKIQHVNPYFEALSGYSLEEMRGKDWFETFLPKRDWKRIRDLYRTSSHGEPTKGNINPIVTRQGREHDIEWHDQAMRDENGKIVGVLAVGLDVTERLKAEYAFREQASMLRRAENLARIGHYAFDVEGGNPYWSEGMKEIWGFSPEETPSFEDLVLLLHPEDAEPVMSAMAQAGEQGTGFDMEYRILRKDGREVMVHSIGEYIPAQQGESPRFFGTLLDITELKQINQHLEDRVTARTQELKAAQGEIVRKEKMATLGQLTATVSHELRNPLGTIQTTAHNLRTRLGEGDEKVVKALERVDRNVVRCNNIIGDLLDFSRTKDSISEVINLNMWITSLLDEQEQPEWLDLAFLPGQEALDVSLDPDRFRRVVINLMDNAVQAMNQAREADADRTNRLDITCQDLGDLVEITFSDTGPGMSEEVVARIFEPLFSTKTYGVGLGLPTVRQIMEQEGGGVSITSREGVGTKARVWLPKPTPASVTMAKAGSQ